MVPSAMRVQRAGDAHHRRNAERVRQDRRVRRAGAFFADQARHVIPVELYGQPGRQLVRHEHHRLADFANPGIVVGAPQQVEQHAELDGLEVGQPVAQHRLPRGLPGVAQFERA